MEGTSEELESFVHYNSKLSVFSNIFTKLNEMLKKPAIESDIKKALDMFMYTLNNPPDHANTSRTNFAEAALILQNSAILYGKKVDLLLDYVFAYQKHLIEYESKNAKKSEESEILEEKIKKFKRSRRKEAEHKVDNRSNVIDKILQEEREEDANVVKNLESVWTTVNNTIPNTTGGLLRMPYESSIIRHKIDENIYVNDTLVCNYEDLHMNTSLQSYKTSRTDFETSVLGNSTTNIDSDMLLQEYLTKEGTTVAKIHKYNLWDDFKKYYDNRNLFDANQRENLIEKCKRLCPQVSTIKLTRLSTDIVKSHLDRYNNLMEENNNDFTRPFRKDSGFFEESESHVDDYVDNSFSESVFNSGTVNLQTSTPKASRKRKDSSVEEEKPKKVKVRSKKEKVLKSVSADLRSFECFYNKEYGISEGESGFAPELPSELDNASDVDMCPSELDNSEMPSTQQSTDSGCDLSSSYKENETITQTALTNDLELEQRNNIKEWKSYILNKIDNDSHRFDMHGCGTEIIDSLSEKSPQRFCDMVKGKTISEITRFFTSSLQLANTYNVELSSIKPGILANDDLHLKLLSKERPHETLEEYEAPSEQSIRKTLKRVNLLNNCDNSLENVCNKKIRLH